MKQRNSPEDSPGECSLSLQVQIPMHLVEQQLILK